MEFKLEELSKKKSDIVLNLTKESLLTLKANLKERIVVELDFEAMNLGQKLYGSNKKESIEIQKKNCKQVLQFFKVCTKAVKLLKKKTKFDGVFYVKNLSQKKNNNDFMIVSLLDIRFNKKPNQVLSKVVNDACDYLDMENEINNMCDFKDNLCVSHRERGLKGKTGCCPSFCKHTTAAVCKVKNLACKIFMCNFLEDRGYYFSVHSIPVMKKHMNYLERFCLAGLLFRTTKKTIAYSWLIRLLMVAYVLVFAFTLVAIIL